MNEQQANEIIKLLDRIDSTLSSIKSNTPSTINNLDDVCSKLDSVEQAVRDMN